MHKVFNILMFLLIIFFAFNVFKYYLSNNNIKNKIFNRSNFKKILKDQKNDLPILTNDTNNVIEFNDSFNIEIKNDKNRSFWKLLKFK
tara:strand:+ start:200 stop:463 length:264 start_codon:yes stop_codon:yes gene_type:complete